MELLGSQFLDALMRHGISFLEQFDSLTAIHDFLRDNMRTELSEPLARLNLAALKAELGDQAGSSQLLIDTSERFPAWRGWAQRMAQGQRAER